MVARSAGRLVSCAGVVAGGAFAGGLGQRGVGTLGRNERDCGVGRPRRVRRGRETGSARGLVLPAGAADDDAPGDYAAWTPGGRKRRSTCTLRSRSSMTAGSPWARP